MGHSFGGLFTRSCSTVGSARRASPSTAPPARASSSADLHARSACPVSLRNPRTATGDRAHHDQFHFAFTNTISEADSQAVYERYAVPGGRPGAVRGRGGELQPEDRDEGRLHNALPRAAAPPRRRPGPRRTGRDRRTRSPSSSRSPPVTELKELPEPVALHGRGARLGAGGRPRARLGRRARGGPSRLAVAATAVANRHHGEHDGDHEHRPEEWQRRQRHVMGQRRGHGRRRRRS